MANIEREDIVYQSVTNLRLHFIDYAMEKYDLTEKQLGEFFKKYDDAVEYYGEKAAKKRALNGVVAVLGNVAAGAGTMLINVAGYNAGEFMLAAGITSGCLLVGVANVCSLMKKDEEYSLHKKNPHIAKGTIFDNMAHEYCEIKKLMK